MGRGEAESLWEGKGWGPPPTPGPGGTGREEELGQAESVPATDSPLSITDAVMTFASGVRPSVLWEADLSIPLCPGSMDAPFQERMYPTRLYQMII